jgi:hypothetical protein
MRRIADLIPWRETVLDARPPAGFVALNPSIHFGGSTWRCVVRQINYPLSKGLVFTPRQPARGVSQNNNVMLVLDPTTWRPTAIHPMAERDGLPRRGAIRGYRDVRLFRTACGGLQGIAASVQLAGATTDEQVALSFDDNYNIVAARPLRGAWSPLPQKNWSPFDGADDPRFLYSIDDGVVFDGETLRGERLTRHGRPGIGLRGGSQLVRVGDEWLGIGHTVDMSGGRKVYQHAVFTCDDDGRPLRRSPPFKLSECDIDFAAGLAIDGDRAVISYGVDDAECRLAETTISALRALVTNSG